MTRNKLVRLAKSTIKLIIPIYFFLCPTPFLFAKTTSLTQEEINLIGERVFENECAGKNQCLVQWNKGEEFLSLGIGHFIWYPGPAKGPFDESFIKLLYYLKASGERLPSWLNKEPPPACPWVSREEFLRHHDDPRVRELQQFLIKTKQKQAQYLVSRLDQALPLILKNAPQERRDHITKNFENLLTTQKGIYALVDYINFKGVGISPKENYNGHGWGLLQVLNDMPPATNNKQTLQEFTKTAKKVLAQRIKNSPVHRNEWQWLAGWERRINTYNDP